jgi:hypothetical protein
MSRGLTDPEPQPEDNQNQEELDNVITDIIIGQNKLHDRLVQLEKEVDHLVSNWTKVKKQPPKKRWHKAI